MAIINSFLTAYINLLKLNDDLDLNFQRLVDAIGFESIAQLIQEYISYPVDQKFTDTVGLALKLFMLISCLANEVYPKTLVGMNLTQNLFSKTQNVYVKINLHLEQNLHNLLL